MGKAKRVTRADGRAAEVSEIGDALGHLRLLLET